MGVKMMAKRRVISGPGVPIETVPCPQYEYLVMETPPMRGPSHTQEFLDSLGEKGWLLVDSGTADQAKVWVFAREI